MQARKRKKKRIIGSADRQSVELPERGNERWSMDFMSDVLSSGTRFLTLYIVDDLSRERTAIDFETSLPGTHVVRVLVRLNKTRGLPKAIVADNGLELISKALDEWAYHNNVRLHAIEPSKPSQNTFVESFNGSHRDDCLNEHWFISLADARRTIENRRIDYNTHRSIKLLRMHDPH